MNPYLRVERARAAGAGRVTACALERLPLQMLRLLARHYRRQLALADAETARRRP